MPGDVSESGITVWFRPITAEALKVQVTGTEETMTKDFQVEPSQPGASVRARLNGLMSNTPHRYQIVNGAGAVLGKGSFRTAPKANAHETPRIAFGSCFHKIGFHNPNLMQLIEKRGNRVMLLLGDLAVDDREAKLNLHHADYLLRDKSVTLSPPRRWSSSRPTSSVSDAL